jgi:cell division protein FtsB
MDTVAEAYLACAAQLRLLTQQLQDSPTRPLAEFIAEQKATPAYQAAKAAERRSAAMEAQLRLFANDSNAPDYVRYYSRLVLGMIAPDGSTR